MAVYLPVNYLLILIPSYFGTSEIHVFLRSSLSQEQRDHWSHVFDHARDQPHPYPHVKATLLQQHHDNEATRKNNPHCIKRRDDETVGQFMDRLIAEAGRDWSNNAVVRHTILQVFLRAMPKELHMSHTTVRNTELPRMARLV